MNHHPHQPARCWRLIAVLSVLCSFGSTTLATTKLTPVVFAVGLLLPSTTRDITPQDPEVEKRFEGYKEDNTEVIFLHNMGKERNPWFGVRGTVTDCKENEVTEDTDKAADNKGDTDDDSPVKTFTVSFTDLVQVHSPYKNIKVVEGRHYVSDAVFLQDKDSSQSVASFLHELILPGLPNIPKIRELRQRLLPMTSINQIVQEMVSFFKLEVSEEQAAQFLECNFSIPDKLRLLMDLFEQARPRLDKMLNGDESRSLNSDDPAAFREKLNKLTLPAETDTMLREAIDQYESMQGNPHEGPILQNYLRFALALPWNSSDEENFDLDQIEKHLDEHQYGMLEVKDRLLDYLALRSVSIKPMPTIMCLAGKPGTGKTSICKVVAEALGKKFARISLGGLHSESAIRGHRRTYIGALPGRIMDGIKRAGTNNPVCVLDEIDKLGTGNSHHGDPGAALLEALDPEQNHEFRDHYLDIDFDLSQVIFIATANDLHKISPALRDRMDVIQVPSYTLEEKIHIARTVIIPRLLSRVEFDEDKKPEFTEKVLEKLIKEHTFEDGLRGMTTKINILIAKYARGYLKDKTKDVLFTADSLNDHLGKAHAQLEEHKRKAKEIEPFLPVPTRRHLFEAIEQFDNTDETDHDHHRVKKYINFFVDLPWGKTTIDEPSFDKIEDSIKSSHHGMEKVKERVIDYLALRKRSEKSRATILCLVGLPGVGKTSICEAIATALGKKFERVALGGASRESDIRGHSRGYIGATPGRILQAIHNAGSKNAVIGLDEIDKLGGNDYNGRADSALLEVLDPEQNRSFTDNYLSEPFDLSDVMFIATANDINKIPHALYDRMEIIHLDGYTTNEKIKIAQNHVLPKLIKQAELENNAPVFSKETIRAIIEEYTSEVGVRKLTLRLNALLAKYARALESGETLIFTPDNLVEHLGPGAGAKRLVKPSQDKVGIVNGLTYSSIGGALLQLEVVAIPGTGEIICTGGNKVAKGSAQAALSYARKHGQKYGVDPHRIKDLDIHVHIPAGTDIPVGGSSGGGALTTACISALTNRPIRHNYAMTGTINLQGQIGAISGLEQKIPGAYASGMTHVIVPLENKEDVEELYKRDKLPLDIKVIYAEHIDEILSRVLLPAPPSARTQTAVA